MSRVGDVREDVTVFGSEQENTIHVYTILYSLLVPLWYRVNINNAGKDYIRKANKKDSAHLVTLTALSL